MGCAAELAVLFCIKAGSGIIGKANGLCAGHIDLHIVGGGAPRGFAEGEGSPVGGSAEAEGGNTGSQIFAAHHHAVFLSLAGLQAGIPPKRGTIIGQRVDGGDPRGLHCVETTLAAAGMGIDEIQGLGHQNKGRPGTADGPKLRRYTVGRGEDSHNPGDAALCFGLYKEIRFVQPILGAGAGVVSDHNTDRTRVALASHVVETSQPIHISLRGCLLSACRLCRCSCLTGLRAASLCLHRAGGAVPRRRGGGKAGGPCTASQ